MSESQRPGSQRREHVRVQLQKRCTVKVPGCPETEVEVVDLSGTGCGFHSWLPVEDGMRGRVRIPFAGWTLDVPFVVRYRRSEPGKGAYVGVQFDALTKSEVEDIVREVFVELRRQLRNRRIVD